MRTLKYLIILLLVPIIGYSQSPFEVLGKRGDQVKRELLSIKAPKDSLVRLINNSGTSDWDYELMMLPKVKNGMYVSFAVKFKNDMSFKVYETFYSSYMLKSFVSDIEKEYKTIAANKAWYKTYKNKDYRVDLTFDTDSGQYSLVYFEMKKPTDYYW